MSNKFGFLYGEYWEKIFDQSRRVYDTDGLSPTIIASGGDKAVKIVEGGTIHQIAQLHPNSADAKLHQHSGIYGHMGVAPTLLATDYKRPKMVTEPIAIEDIEDSRVFVPSANKRGFEVAELGDGLYLNRPHQKRGTVQSKSVPTIKTNGNDIGVVVKVDGIYTDASDGFMRPPLDNVSRTLKASAHDAGIVETREIGRFHQQAIETMEENDVKSGDVINAYNKTVDGSGAVPTITTRPEGFKTAILTVVGDSINGLRVRKLTPRECWRLMEFSDEDFDRASKVNSATQLYKQAGNSIVALTLAHLFTAIHGDGSNASQTIKWKRRSKTISLF